MYFILNCVYYCCVMFIVCCFCFVSFSSRFSFCGIFAVFLWVLGFLIGCVFILCCDCCYGLCCF